MGRLELTPILRKSPVRSIPGIMGRIRPMRLMRRSNNNNTSITLRMGLRLLTKGIISLPIRRRPGNPSSILRKGTVRSSPGITGQLRPIAISQGTTEGNNRLACYIFLQKGCRRRGHRCLLCPPGTCRMNRGFLRTSGRDSLFMATTVIVATEEFLQRLREVWTARLVGLRQRNNQGRNNQGCKLMLSGQGATHPPVTILTSNGFNGGQKRRH